MVTTRQDSTPGHRIAAWSAYSLLWLFVVLLWSEPPCLAQKDGLGGVSGKAAGAAGFAGRPLAEAIHRLEARGLEVFFTSQTVAPGLVVESEPRSTTPLAILFEILAPHGLEAEQGPGGRWVVVEAGPSRLMGQVRARGGALLTGVRVVVFDEDEAIWGETTSDDAGRFELDGLPVGWYGVEARRPGFIIARHHGIEVRSRGATQILFELDPAPVTRDEIMVVPSRVSLLREGPVSGIDLGRDDILALPHLGDDIFRAFTLLPGIAGEEASAQFSVRGGRPDEVLVLLDRFELFEAYHLKDYSSAVSIVPPRALREVNLLTGGFPAEYGDRMSGVLDMTTLDADRRRTQLGVSAVTAEVAGAGPLAGGEGSWLGSLRRSTLDLTFKVFKIDERPSYWDVFAKVDRNLRPGRSFGLRILHSDDKLDNLIFDPDTNEDYDTAYDNSYVWLAHQEILGARLFVDTVVSAGRVRRDRGGIETELDEENEGEGFFLRDQRRLDALGLKQDWNAERGGRHSLKWGFDIRRLETDYDYLNQRQLDDPLAEIRSEPRTGTTRLVETFRGDQYGLYFSDQMRLADPLTLELGLRYDEHELTDDRHFSPRFNLLWTLDEASSLRLAWGFFYQSQRPYELQVEDGESTFAGAESTEHRVLGYERRFHLGQEGSPLFLRIEAYQREVRDPRVRYENIFEPITIFPEIEADRYKIVPEHSSAWGIELLLRGTGRRGIKWWLSYAYARTRDRIGGRWVPRRIDQPHTLNLDVDLPLGEHWHLNLAWRYHTGWPTTAFSGRLEEDDEGEVEEILELGPINGERLSSYHRLDLRASREWQRRKGRLGFFFDVQNLYDRRNQAGFDVEFEFGDAPREDGTIEVTTIEEIWGGLRPSIGITWEF